MNLLQLQKETKERWGSIPKYQTIEFEMIDWHDNRLKCTWLDPHQGTFTMQGITSGYMTVEDYEGKFPAVDNIKVVKRT